MRAVGAESSTQVGVPAGALLAGKYRIEKKLGEGGMGAVYLAINAVLDQRVVLKMLHSSSDELTARFLREARVAAKVQHENVTRVLDFGRLPDGAPFLVMEFLDGYDLDRRVHEGGPLSVPEAATRVLDALRGLAVIHDAGIIHRDIKPANLFVAQRQGGGEVVKILDFGLAKSSEESLELTSSSASMGSPLYMAPEQLRSSKTVDTRADIWSMGVTLYEILAQRPPFDGTGLGDLIPKIMSGAPAPLREVRADVPPELEAVIHRCLQKDRNDRFPDARAFAAALAPFAPGAAPLSEPSLAVAKAPAPTVPAPPGASPASAAASQTTVSMSSLRTFWITTAIVTSIGIAGIAIAVTRMRAHSTPPVVQPVPTETSALAPPSHTDVPPPPPVASSSSPAVVVSAPASNATAHPAPRPSGAVPTGAKTTAVPSVSTSPAAPETPPPAPKPKDFEGRK